MLLLWEPIFLREIFEQFPKKLKLKNVENVNVINWTRKNVGEWLVANKLDSFVEVCSGKLPRTTYVICFRDFASTVITEISFFCSIVTANHNDEFINMKSWCCAA